MCIRDRGCSGKIADLLGCRAPEPTEKFYHSVTQRSGLSLGRHQSQRLLRWKGQRGYLFGLVPHAAGGAGLQDQYPLLGELAERWIWIFGPQSRSDLSQFGGAAGSPNQIQNPPCMVGAAGRIIGSLRCV